MADLQQLYYLPPPPLPTPPAAPSAPAAPTPTCQDPPPGSSSRTGDEPPPTPPPRFDPSRTIGIIRRKALIKDLAAVYHAECLTYCQELLELQKKLEEPSPNLMRILENTRKETTKPPPKRLKKSR